MHHYLAEHTKAGWQIPGLDGHKDESGNSKQRVMRPPAERQDPASSSQRAQAYGLGTPADACRLWGVHERPLDGAPLAGLAHVMGAVSAARRACCSQSTPPACPAQRD
jgi:hypothetical protein